MHELAQRGCALNERRSCGLSGDHKKVFTFVNFIETRKTLLPHRKFRGSLETKVGFGVRVIQMISYFAAFQQHIQRNNCGSGFENTIIDDGEIG